MRRRFRGQLIRSRARLVFLMQNQLSRTRRRSRRLRAGNLDAVHETLRGLEAETEAMIQLLESFSCSH